MIWVREGIVTDKSAEKKSVTVVSNNPIAISIYSLRIFNTGPSIIDELNPGDIVEFCTLKIGNHVQWAFDLKKLSRGSDNKKRYRLPKDSIAYAKKSRDCKEFEYMENTNNEFLGQFEKKKEILHEIYPFIGENIFICAYGDIFFGNQAIVLRKVNPVNGHIEMENYIGKIFDSKPKIEIEETLCLQEIPENLKEINKKSIGIYSNGIVKEICLKHEEEFKRLKSWVANIAKLGLEFYKIKNEFNISANLEYSLDHFILLFLIRAKEGLILKFIERIGNKDTFEIVRHESGLIANLTLILEMLYISFIGNISDGDRIKKILSAVIQINPAAKIFIANPKFTHLIIHYNPDLLNVLLRLIKDESGEDTKKLVSNLTPTFELLYMLSYGDYYPGQIVSRIDEEERYLNLPLELFFENPKFVHLIQYFDESIFDDYLAGIYINYKPNSEELFEKLGGLLNFIKEYYMQLYNEEYFHLSFNEFLENMYVLNPPDELFLKNPKLLNIFLFTGEYNLIQKLEKQTNSTLKPCLDNDSFHNPGYRIQEGIVVGLSLTHLELTEFPDMVFEFDHLEYLSISRNQIKSLPPSILMLKNLKCLNFSYNKITKIPDSLLKMTNLKRVWVENNKNIQISEDIEHLLNDS